MQLCKDWVRLDHADEADSDDSFEKRKKKEEKTHAINQVSGKGIRHVEKKRGQDATQQGPQSPIRICLLPLPPFPDAEHSKVHAITVW